MSEENNKKVVKWQIFIWALGIILILFGISFSFISNLTNKVDAVEKNTGDVREQLSQIQTDISWIKNNLKIKD